MKIDGDTLVGLMICIAIILIYAILMGAQGHFITCVVGIGISLYLMGKCFR